MTIATLPIDIWKLIIRYLPPQELLNLARVSKYFQTLSNESPSWPFFCQRDFGGLSYTHEKPILTYLRCQKGHWKFVNRVASQWIKFLYFNNEKILCVENNTNPLTIHTYTETKDRWKKNNTIYLNDTLSADYVYSMIHLNNHFVTGSSNPLNQIQVWNENGKCTQKLFAHTDNVSALIQTPNQLISASHDTTIRIWDIEKKIHQILKGHTSPIRALHFRDRELISGAGHFETFDFTVRIWDLRQKNPVAILRGHPHTINTLHSTEDKIISSSRSETFIWDRRQLKPLSALELRNTLQFAPAGEKVLGIADNYLFSLDLLNFKYQKIFSHDRTFTHLVRNGDRLLLGGNRFVNQEENILLMEIFPDKTDTHCQVL